jgi:hypothetical protein
VLLLSTETLEWAKSKAYPLPSDSPVVQIDYEHGQSYLTLPAAVASGKVFAPVHGARAHSWRARVGRA